MTRLGSVALAALLLAPGALAWSQYRGEADRTRPVDLPDGPLDVLGTLRILEGEERLSTFLAPAAVERADGTLLSLGPGCSVIAWTPTAGVVSREALADCAFATLLGIDAARDLLVLCTPTQAGSLLRAYDATDLAPAWSVDVADITPASAASLGWSCTSGAFHPASDAWYVLAATPGEIRVVAVDPASGDVRWSSTVSSEGPPAPALLPTTTAPSGGSVTPRGLTVTDTGIVVTLYVFGCPTCAPRAEEGAIAWLTLDGRQVDAFRARTDGRLGGNAESSPTISHAPVAQGGIATLVLGGQVALVNPESEGLAASAPLRGLEPATNYIFWQPPMWHDATIVYPQLHGLVAYTRTLEFLWAWTGGADNFTSEVVPTSHGSLLVLQGRELEGARLIELDLRDGSERGLWPLPVEPPEAQGNDDDYDAQLLSTTDGRLMTIDPAGQVVLLGGVDASERPTVEADLYPGPTERLVIEPRHPAAVSWRVHWGDGAIDVAEGSAPSFAHAWGTPGDRVVRVSAVLEDGRTATRDLTVFVGGTPPPELTPLQRAFSPENQEITFFVLGLLVTIFGVAFTIGRQRRRFNRLERELSAVEEIRMMSISDPRAAVIALKSYRDRLPDDLARRRIDDSQYHILDLRSARLLKVLRTRMFAPYDDRLSQRFHRLLDAAFEDAILQPSERDALIAALDAEPRASPEDRERMARILRDFTSERHAPGGG